MIRPGDSFPHIQGKTCDGIEINTARLLGQPFVAWFYAKDGSSQCIALAQEFSNAMKDFEALGVTVFGVSTDTLGSHEAFSQQHNISVPLLSDERGGWARQLGILDEDGLAERTTFFVDHDGVIEKIWTNITPTGHAKNILYEVKELLHSARYSV